MRFGLGYCRAVSAALALLTVAAVGLNVERARGLSDEELVELVAGVETAFGTLGEDRVVLDAQVQWECAPRDECLSQIAERTQSAHVVLLSVYAGPTKIRLGLERLDPAGRKLAESEVDLARAGWQQQELHAAVEPLISSGSPAPPPEAPPSPKLPLRSPTTETNEPGSIPPAMWAVSAGALVAAVGVGFAVSSASASSELQGSFHRGDDATRLISQAEDHSTVAGVLVMTGAAALVAGVIAIVLTD